MGVQGSRPASARLVVYVTIELEARLLVVTVEEFMDLPRSMYVGAKMGLVVGEEDLVELLKAKTNA